MLELRPNCEMCDKDLPPHALDARICSYECTFCAVCVDVVLKNVCPNCAGGFVPRPIRPLQDRRAGVSLLHQPALAKRHSLNYSLEDIARQTDATKDIAPQDR